MVIFYAGAFFYNLPEGFLQTTEMSILTSFEKAFGVKTLDPGFAHFLQHYQKNDRTHANRSKVSKSNRPEVRPLESP